MCQFRSGYVRVHVLYAEPQNTNPISYEKQKIGHLMKIKRRGRDERGMGKYRSSSYETSLGGDWSRLLMQKREDRSRVNHDIWIFIGVTTDGTPSRTVKKRKTKAPRRKRKGNDP